MCGSSSLSSSAILVAEQMLRYLRSFVFADDTITHANPRGNMIYIDDRPFYGSDDNILGFQPIGAGFNLTGDELHRPQIVLWDKVHFFSVTDVKMLTDFVRGVLVQNPTFKEVVILKG